MTLLDKIHDFISYRPEPGATYIMPEDPGLYHKRLKSRISDMKASGIFFPSLYLLSLGVVALLSLSYFLEGTALQSLGITGFNTVSILITFSTLIYEAHFGHSRGFIFYNFTAQIFVFLLFIYSLNILPGLSFESVWSSEMTSPYIALYCIVFMASYGNFSKHPILQTSLSYITLIGAFLCSITWTLDITAGEITRHASPLFLVICILLVFFRTRFIFVVWSRKFWFIDGAISAGLYVITVSLVNQSGSSSFLMNSLYLFGYLCFLELLRRIVWYRQDDIDIYLELDAQRRSNKAREEQRESLVRTMSHDLRSPLINAKDLILEAESLTSKGRLTRDEIDKRVLENLDRIDVLSRGMTSYFSVGSRPETIEEFELGAFLDKVISRYENRLDIQCVSRQPGTVFANELALARCFENLFENTIIHSGVDKPLCIVTDYVKDGYHFVDIEDNGIGIPEEDRRRVLLPFVKTKTTSKGSGLGMSIVAMEMASFGGSIEVLDPIILTGARFSLKIPIIPKREMLPFEKHLFEDGEIS